MRTVVVVVMLLWCCCDVGWSYSHRSHGKTLKSNDETISAAAMIHFATRRGLCSGARTLSMIVDTIWTLSTYTILGLDCKQFYHPIILSCSKSKTHPSMPLLWLSAMVVLFHHLILHAFSLVVCSSNVQTDYLQNYAGLTDDLHWSRCFLFLLRDLLPQGCSTANL